MRTIGTRWIAIFTLLMTAVVPLMSFSPKPAYAASGNQAVVNSKVLKDTAGNEIYAQAGGMLRVGDTYYWYGVEYEGAHSSSNDQTFMNVNCYSSTDLVHWTFENHVVAAGPSGSTFASDNYIGRTDIVYNANTQKYVLIMTYQTADGTTKGLAFATSGTPTGTFSYQGVQTSIDNVYYDRAGDHTTFVDDNGSAYLIFSDAHGRSKAYIAPLRSSDYLHVEPATQIKSFAPDSHEANTMFKRNGVYYYCASETVGWKSSQTSCMTSASLFGTYSAPQVIADSDATNSNNSQIRFVLPVQGTSGTTYMYVGDRYSDFTGVGTGLYVWEPLEFNGTTPVFHSLNAWVLNASEGRYSKYVRLKNRSTGLYIDGMGRTANGDDAGQWSGGTSYNQQWMIQAVDVTGGHVQIVNRATGLYLDGMGRTANGDDLGQWSYSGGDNQIFGQVNAGDYVKFHCEGNDLYIDGMGHTANGDAVGQWSWGSSSNQQWEYAEHSL